MEDGSDKIRRPMNAFMIFAKERRNEIQSQNPYFSNNKVSVLLGQEWKSFSEEKKIPYKMKAQELDRAHKILYPGYVYSPAESRKRKAERMMEKVEKKTSNGRLIARTLKFDVLDNFMGKKNRGTKWTNKSSDVGKGSEGTGKRNCHSEHILYQNDFNVCEDVLKKSNSSYDSSFYYKVEDDFAFDGGHDEGETDLTLISISQELDYITEPFNGNYINQDGLRYSTNNCDTSSYSNYNQYSYEPINNLEDSRHLIVNTMLGNETYPPLYSYNDSLPSFEYLSSTIQSKCSIINDHNSNKVYENL